MSLDAVADPATRVALLARAGVARERLQTALREVGADIVLVADPAETDASRVRATGAEAILIALEPAVDDALERYDALLADPDITVIFDEAELAAGRAGWDAARWSRHLAAKLNRHERVLPPGGETDADAGRSAAIDGDDTYFLGQVGARSPGLSALGDVAMTADTGFLQFDPTLAEFDTSSDLDGPMADLAFQLPPIDFDAVPRQDMPTGVPGITRPLELVLDDTGAATDKRADAAEAAAGSNERFRRDLDALQTQAAELQLDAPKLQRAVRQDGAVLIMAGIGGPDAVRQLLGGLSAAFPRPVLLQQRLDGGQHDKLVRQMQRATPMPVQLAQAGVAPSRGHVYVLPAGMGVVGSDDGLKFAVGSDDVIANLPSRDSAVILLSGSDPAMVDAAISLGFHGALVAGQLPDSCFDPTATSALIARGGACGTPPDLARELVNRWQLSLED